ncbi:gamma-glutamylcyclotransferase family protein [Streptomyces sp. URMC 123]|uniref:gamma-glutamylcyclotransferase family protein n=1 Tax=Streptomyces sp. URMC 123 TaxID=3423403 RepID=UPI003F194A00
MAPPPERPPVLRLPVFVYGTLRPGHGNHRRFLLGRTEAEEPAVLRGAVLYEGPGYPYAVAAPEGEIRGELITPPRDPAAYDALLAELDALEEYVPGAPDNLYERVARAVRLADGRTAGAWVYLAGERVARRLRGRGAVVPGGDWAGARPGRSESAG